MRRQSILIRRFGWAGRAESECCARAGNAANGNHAYGFYLYSSFSNTLTGNMASGDGSVGFYLWSSSTNSLSKNTANSNYHAGFDLNHSSNNNKLNLNIANMNSGYGYIDTSSGSGTRGTTNFYASDECSSNGAGGSHPSELGTPQP